MDAYDEGLKLGMRRKRNCAEDSATVKGKRPDFFLLSSRALLFKGEDKTSEAEFEKALEELSTKLKEWGAAVHGEVMQVNSPCYSAAGHAQCCLNSLCYRSCACKVPVCFCMLHVAWVSRGNHAFCFLFHCRWITFCAMLALARNSRYVPCDWRHRASSSFAAHYPWAQWRIDCRLLGFAVQSYWVMKAQAKQLPEVLLPLGRTETTTFSKVQIFDSFAQKRITFSSETWPHSRCQLMATVYAASRSCPFLIHAQESPHKSQNGKEYIVDLEPVGQPVLSKHSDQRPQSSRELKKIIRCATIPC